MTRVTVRDAERQAARLAKSMGYTFHYTNMRKGDTITLDMAESVPYGTIGAWVIDQSAMGGWLNLFKYSNEQGGLTYAINHDSWKAATLWDICRFTIDALDRMK